MKTSTKQAPYSSEFARGFIAFSQVIKRFREVAIDPSKHPPSTIPMLLDEVRLKVIEAHESASTLAQMLVRQRLDHQDILLIASTDVARIRELLQPQHHFYIRPDQDIDTASFERAEADIRATCGAIIDPFDRLCEGFIAPSGIAADLRIYLDRIHDAHRLANEVIRLGVAGNQRFEPMLAMNATRIMQRWSILLRLAIAIDTVAAKTRPSSFPSSSRIIQIHPPQSVPTD